MRNSHSWLLLVGMMTSNFLATTLDLQGQNLTPGLHSVIK